MSETKGSSFAAFSTEDYDSEFEFDTEVGEKRKARHDLATKPQPSSAPKPKRQSFHEECAAVQGRPQQQAYLSLDAYTRHKKLINDYVLCYSGATEKLKRNTSHYKTDHDVIKENHRFLWEEEDNAHTWGEQLAKKYYDRLFKEYCLCDLSRYKQKQIGMRWRTEKEVILGKGQFFCGSVHCEAKGNLETYEVLFGYQEKGEKRNALVKIRVCERCCDKLHYGYKGKTLSRVRRKVPQEQMCAETSSETDNPETDSKSEKGEGCVEESDVWKQPVREEAEPTKEDAFEEFLEDLFL